MNRYQGNSGQRRSWPDESGLGSAPAPPHGAARRQPAAVQPERRMAAGPADGLSRLVGLLPQKLGQLETEDLILMLILYLLYKESGDKELLLMIGAMFLF